MSKLSEHIVRSGAGALLAQGSLHLQLIQVEWALEKLRFKRMIKLVLVGVSMFICSLLSVGALVMMISWDTEYKVTAAVVLVGLYSIGAVIAYICLQHEEAKGSTAFADSRSEIAADIALLRDRLS